MSTKIDSAQFCRGGSSRKENVAHDPLPESDFDRSNRRPIARFIVEAVEYRRNSWQTSPSTL